MAAGADVIYQATFFDGTFRGHADFLLRVDSPDRPSRWGPWHYEVADTKLARHVKASAVLQICSYVDQLERHPGRPAGVDARRARRERAHRRATPRRRLHGLLPERPRPVPGDARGRDAADVPAARDVPGAGRALRRLSLGGRMRRTAADRRPPEPRGGDHRPPAARPDSNAASRPSRPSATCRCRWSRRSRTSARVRSPGSTSRRGSSSRDDANHGSSTSSSCPRPTSEIELERGLASLPPPSPGDLFFDIEGDPYALDDGLDYLFGVLETDGDVPRHLVARRRRRVLSRRRAARLRAADGPHHGPARAATRRCTSTTTRRTSRPRSSG